MEERLKGVVSPKDVRTITDDCMSIVQKMIQKGLIKGCNISRYKTPKRDSRYRQFHVTEVTFQATIRNNMSHSSLDDYC